jgi:hypothetical protein
VYSCFSLLPLLGENGESVCELPFLIVFRGQHGGYNESFVKFSRLHAHLFPEQIDDLKTVLSKKSVYASLPTVYGKSMIFYAIPLVLKILKTSRDLGTRLRTATPPQEEVLEISFQFMSYSSSSSKLKTSQ